jgi:hypothetical protein
MNSSNQGRFAALIWDSNTISPIGFAVLVRVVKNTVDLAVNQPTGYGGGSKMLSAFTLALHESMYELKVMPALVTSVCHQTEGPSDPAPNR